MDKSIGFLGVSLERFARLDSSIRPNVRKPPQASFAPTEAISTSTKDCIPISRCVRPRQIKRIRIQYCFWPFVRCGFLLVSIG
jgi:hypothetical protein